MKKPIISLSNIAIGYDNKPVLKNISFEISRGEIFIIMGPSGCGKSTLLRAMSGLLRPMRGRIEIDRDAEHRGFVSERCAVYIHDGCRKYCNATDALYRLHDRTY